MIKTIKNHWHILILSIFLLPVLAFASITGNVLRSNDANTLINNKVSFSPEGCLLVKLTNKTGGATVKGTLAHPYDATAVEDAFTLTPDDAPDTIGVVYEAGVADGAEAWVCVQGLGEIYFEAAVARGEFARSQVNADGGTVGYAVAEAAPTSPFATDKHFQEVGHVIETTGGAGLANAIIHFN